MNWPWVRTPMPLLGKELAEQAARKRTYRLRVLYAVLLFLVFCLYCYSEYRRRQHARAMMGRGREMFDVLVIYQFVGIALFLPAMMSGVLTYEKERRSMALLLLTDLRPRDVLLQKYLGRLVPMLAFLLLSLPPLAICYVYGGITQEAFVVGVATLFLTCLQVGALALMCSAWCRTSVGAFISSYVLLALFYLVGPVLADELGLLPTRVAAALMPMAGYLNLRRFGPDWFVTSGACILLSTALFLVVARLFLVRRAFVTPKNTLLAAFERLDRVFAAANRLVGNVELGKERDSLPDEAPIAWRERAKKSLGKGRYLFRIFLLLEAPVLGFSLYLLTWGTTRQAMQLLSLTMFGLWVLAALAVTVLGANTIVAERTHETLDVLLTTPLTGRDILRQKMRGLRRAVLVVAVPLLTLAVVRAWWRVETGGARPWSEVRAAEYLVASALTVAVYLPMLAWYGLLMSLRARTRFRAVIAALLVLAVWVAVPFLVYVLLESGFGLRFYRRPHAYLVLLSSPAMLIVCAELGPPYQLGMGMLTALNTVLYVVVLSVMRFRCLARADRYLGRAVAREGWAGGPAPAGEPSSEGER